MHHVLERTQDTEAKLLAFLAGPPPFKGAKGSYLFLEAYRYYYLGSLTLEHPCELQIEAEKAYASYQETGTVPDFFARIPRLYAKESTIRDAPTAGRHITQDDSKLKDVLLGVMSIHPQHVHMLREHDPAFWKLVFTGYFNASPKGDDDPLWDTLFATGMPLMRKLKTASS